ncbi:MAG: hypothetical protein CTY25_08795 [Methylobacterium sp.]|nr:MAG: hypothetical protein CTY25_08795 [Methylobacterium sp.]
MAALCPVVDGKLLLFRPARTGTTGAECDEREWRATPSPRSGKPDADGLIFDYGTIQRFDAQNAVANKDRGHVPRGFEATPPNGHAYASRRKLAKQASFLLNIT